MENFDKLRELRAKGMFHGDFIYLNALEKTFKQGKFADFGADFKTQKSIENEIELKEQCDRPVFEKHRKTNPKFFKELDDRYGKIMEILKTEMV